MFHIGRLSVHIKVCVAHRERGRLKRFLIFEGRVTNNLNLKEFPFDFNSIDIEFGFVSHWRSKNGEKYGTASNTPIYRLREVRDPREGDIIGTAHGSIQCYTKSDLGGLLGRCMLFDTIARIRLPMPP